MPRGKPLQRQVKGDIQMVLICSISSLVTEATSHELKISNVFYYVCIEFINKGNINGVVMVTEAMSHELKISNICIIIYVLNL